MTYVIKIKYEDTLRRLSYNGNRPYGDAFGGKLTFAKLEARIKDLFKIQASEIIRVTYTDLEGDVITMGDDQDVEDACVLQGLNPLRLNVTVLKSVATDRTQNECLSSLPGSMEKSVMVKQMLKDLPADLTMPIASHCARMVGRAATPDEVIELVDAVVLAVTSRPEYTSKVMDLATAKVSHPSVGLVVSATSHDPVSSPLLQSLSPQKSATTGIPEGNQIQATLPYDCGGERNSFNDVGDTEASETVAPCHTRVQCDACGMNPIVGPRFKSITKYDYDLCLRCYKEKGSSKDYQRIDRPLFRPRHIRCPAFNQNFHTGRGAGLSFRGPFNVRHDHTRQGVHVTGCGGKLDARFVQDVTIFDGTELAPLTRFTKTWRLRNSGTLPWPLDTRLTRVGGDELGDLTVVLLELPERGLPPGVEVELSVDLVAPEKPGRYVSHWRLMAPNGQKFGHRVWVLIQVVCKEGEDALLNEMSLPSASEDLGKEGMKLRDVDKKADDETRGVLTGHTLFLAEDYPNSISSSIADTEFCPPESLSKNLTRIAVDMENNVDMEINVQVSNEGMKGTLGTSEGDVISEDNKLSPDSHVQAEFPSDEGNGKDVVVEAGQRNDSGPTNITAPDDFTSFVNSELGGFSIVDRMDLPQLESSSSSAVRSMSSASCTATRSLSSKDIPGDSLPITDERDGITEEVALDEKRLMTLTLCEKLEGMGFSDRALNIELLEKNGMDLRRTVDQYLLSAAEWDPILGELEDMGFYDMDLNRHLMFKNNGSVKRVVKELVQMYKVPVDSVKANRKGKVVE